MPDAIGEDAMRCGRLRRSGRRWCSGGYGALRDARVEEHLLIAGMALLRVGAKKRRELAEWLAEMPDDDSPYKTTLLGALA